MVFQVFMKQLELFQGKARRFSIRETLRLTSEDQRTEWEKFLEGRNIFSNEFDEFNWSGRGQHVEYTASDAALIPLHPVKVLGHTSSAFVESVLCRRILLARKTINCQRRMTREEAIKEVEHLQRLKHSHIVRVVGTYTLLKNLAILLYPVAEWNLKDFLEEILEEDHRDVRVKQRSLRSFFGCLSASLSFIHASRTKHLDIKPLNILVKDMGPIGIGVRSDPTVRLRYKVIIADFGIARHYSVDEEVETESPLSFTRKYAAPEVVDQSPRGLAADIFSLGCVFTEMTAVLASTPLFLETASDLSDFTHAKRVTTSMPNWDFMTILRNRLLSDGTGDASYQANISKISTLVSEACFHIAQKRQSSNDDDMFKFECHIIQMMAPQPELRPTAADLTLFFENTHFFFPCPCGTDPDPFIATDSSLIDNMKKSWRSRVVV